jgi:CHASE2 domain-containing sensor protein
MLKQQGQIGFADQVEDADGKVRRALLSVLTDTTRYSLAVQLALHYLAVEGIQLQDLDQSGQRSRLGKAIFQPFKADDGGYRGAEAGGYQLLLNFRGTESRFLRIPLRQVLNHRIPPNLFRDRIVLIGYTAESINDRFRTPYNGGWFSSAPRINGVTLHANIVSQLISAALDERPLIHVWPELLKGFWILLWAGIGTIAAWGLRSFLKLAIGLLLASGGLLSGSYAAFLIGWWIPVVPPLLSLGGGALALVIVASKQRDHLRFQRTLALLLAARQDYPTAARLAIEYLKQSETKEHQAAIDRQLR